MKTAGADDEDPWDEVRRRESQHLLIFVGMPIIMGVLARFMPFLLAVAIYTPLFFYFGRKNMESLCPQCGQPFHENVKRRTTVYLAYGYPQVMRFGAPIRFRCPNCGIRKGDPIQAQISEGITT